MQKLTLQIKNHGGDGPFKLGIPKIIGFFLGIPFSWPGPPMYILAFGCFFAAFVRSPQKIILLDSKKKFAVYILISLAIVSNVVALSSIELDSVRVMTTVFFFILLMFDEMIDDKRELLDGFTKAMHIWALLVLAFAIYLKIYEYGVLLFSVPDYRLWGSEYFPDWPNYLAFMLSLAFMLNVLVFGRHGVATVQLAAALLTTSRTPFLALGLCIFAVLFARGVFRSFRKGLLLGLMMLSIAFSFFFAFEVDKDLVDRLLIFEDREEIYRFGVDMVFKSPSLGSGSILLDESVGFYGFPSFHNSYLDISVRHGIPALVIFLLILIPNRENRRVGGAAFAATVLFFLIGSVFQNFMKHPHIVMIYVVCANSGYLFHKKYEK